MKNEEVAQIFTGMADRLAIQGANHHRIMAYRRAAENMSALGQSIEEVWRAGQLDSVPGFGKTLAAKIDELMCTGQVEAYERLKAQVPPGVIDMLQVRDVGPKRAALFWKELAITSVSALEQAAREGRLNKLPGVGVKTEERVLAGIEALRRHTGRTLLGVAWPLALGILSALREVPAVVRAAPAGSLRRRRETVSDLDLLVAVDETRPATQQAARRVMAHFRELPQVSEVVLSGSIKTSVRTHGGLQVDLRVLEPARWGTAIQYFTGSQAHNIHLRRLALDRGLSLSEYGFEKEEDGTEDVCPTEEEVYATLGLPTIPPELREDRGEIEAATDGRLPDLIEYGDVKGDLHFHTAWSDGTRGLLEMATAARARGLTYGLVTDHTWSLGVAGGLSVERVREQRAAIAEANRRLAGEFRLLAGTEAEVRDDGSLDFPDEVLAEFDLVVAALHSGLRRDRGQVTARMLAAIHNPHVDIVAHPTGRLIGEREGADLDMEAIFAAAAETGTALEINADPRRLDLRDLDVRRAVELGVTLAIGSDAHGPDGFAVLPFGVATARRGWATSADVLNARSVGEVLAWARGRGSMTPGRKDRGDMS